MVQTGDTRMGQLMAYQRANHCGQEPVSSLTLTSVFLLVAMMALNLALDRAGMMDITTAGY